MFKEWASFVIIAVEQLNLFLSCLCLLWHKRSVTPHWEILILERINYKLRYSIYNNQTLCLNRWMIWYFHIMVSFLKVISNVFCRWKYPLNTDNLQVLSKHLSDSKSSLFTNYWNKNAHAQSAKVYLGCY